MDEDLQLPINYNGHDMVFGLKLLAQGYLHKIQVTINGVDVLFEPDEERNYRALVSAEELQAHKLDVRLLQAIAHRIEEVVKD